jgi:hypothetical protein
MLLLNLLERPDFFARFRVIDVTWRPSPSGAEPVITFRAGVGKYSTDLGSATARELGFPISIDAFRRSSEGFPALREPLKWPPLIDFLYNQPPEPYPVQIYFPQRDGYLAMLPWESLLRVPYISGIRRLPYYSLPSPRCTLDDLALVIDPALTVLTSTMRTIIGNVMSAFRSVSGNALHLFASDSLAAAVQKSIDISQPAFVHAYDSAKEQPTFNSPSTENRPGFIENNFLRWVSDEAAGNTVNWAVFICQGAIECNEGVAYRPVHGTQKENVPSSRLSVAAAELTSFVMYLGASASAFIEPSGSQVSLAGLRLLTDRMAQMRPGTTMVVGADDSDGLDSFFGTPPFGWQAGWPPYAWPSYPWPIYWPELEALNGRIADALERFTLLRDLVRDYQSRRSYPSSDYAVWRLPERPSPRWAIAVQRHLEVWAARLLEGSEDETVKSGVEESVINIRDTVSRYLRRAEGGTAS